MPLLRAPRARARLLLGSAAAVTAVSMLGSVATAVPATAADPVQQRASSGAATRGLYGSQDPTYDGVYRQGLSIVALRTAHARVQPAAVQWLLRQQCANGRWTSYRASLRQPCAAGDTNATALAVIALAQLGRTKPARAGMAWLRSVQQADGGWYFSSAYGTTSDVNSTTLALQAALALGIAPRTISNHGNDGYAYLRSMLLRCSEPLPTRGALGFSTDSPTANDFATAPALQGLARTTLPVAPARSWSAPASRDCSGGRWGLSPKEATASYLAARLRANPDGIPYTAGGVDVGTTANAVLGLVAAGTARGQVRAGLQVLRAQARAFVVSSGRTVPGSAALLTLVAHATHGNPRSFAGLDLVQRIRGSIRP